MDRTVRGNHRQRGVGVLRATVDADLTLFLQRWLNGNSQRSCSALARQRSVYGDRRLNPGTLNAPKAPNRVMVLLIACSAHPLL